MKKALLLACAFISIASISQAQIKKGSVLLGGGINFYKNESESSSSESKYNSFGLNPSVGLAIKDNWVVGINGGYSKSKLKPNTPLFKDETNSYSAGAFVRRYHGLGKSFYPFGNAAINYGKSEREEVPGTDYRKITSTRSISLGLAPGIAYAVGKRFHLEAYLNDLFALNYSKNEAESISFGNSNKTEDKSLYLAANFNTSNPLSIGFRFVLGK